MNFKKLTIAAAIVAMTSLSAVAPVYAQAAPAAPAADQNAAPAPAAPAADQAAAPAPAAPSDAAKSAAAPADVPAQYSLGHICQEGSWISKAILIVLAIMSAGTWYIFFTKWIEQQRILGQATQVEKKFWTSATLNEGVDKLPKTSVFRGIAEAGLKASTGGTTLVGLNDWIGMTLTRQLEDANARLQGGIAFLGSVGSVSPFVGLL
jgi:biopolymer transport protein ExbB